MWDIYRLDRYLHGGDHEPSLAQGWPAMAPIHHLPIELLRSIFELAVLSQPLPDDRDNTMLTSEVVISHVCRHWRGVAVDDPRFWSLIHFRTKSHFHRANVYIQRCSRSNPNYPLDIYVDTCSEETHKVRDDLLFRDEFLSIFDDVLLKHIHRWREFHLKVADLTCKAGARKVLHNCGSAPALRTLQLWHVQDWGTPEHLFNAIGPPPVIVFAGELPSLKHIILQGVNLPWSGSPFLRDLTSIEYALHSDDVRMPFSLWQDMLRASPALQRISLHYSGPRARALDGAARDGIEWWGADPPHADADVPPHAALPPAADPVRLPALVEIDLHELEPGYLVRLFRTFEAPNVRSLSLELDTDDEDYAPFLRYLAAPPAAAPHANGANGVNGVSWRSISRMY